MRNGVGALTRNGAQHEICDEGTREILTLPGFGVQIRTGISDANKETRRRRRSCANGGLNSRRNEQHWLTGAYYCVRIGRCIWGVSPVAILVVNGIAKQLHFI